MIVISSFGRIGLLRARLGTHPRDELALAS